MTALVLCIASYVVIFGFAMCTAVVMFFVVLRQYKICFKSDLERSIELLARVAYTPNK